MACLGLGFRPVLCADRVKIVLTCPSQQERAERDGQFGEVATRITYPARKRSKTAGSMRFHFFSKKYILVQADT